MSTITGQIPTSQVAAQLTAGSNPVSTLRVNQTAEVPTFPSSGTNTFVRVLWASIDPIDIKLARLPWPLSRLALGSNPIVPGLSYVGRVWKTNNSRLQPGDIVWGKLGSVGKFGTLAGYVLVSGDQGIVKVPESYTRGLDEFGGAGVISLTALQTLKAGDLPYNTSGGQSRGGKVFINGGSGGVGTFTVQMAKHVFGCDKVVVSCSGANADLVKSLGADEVVDYRNCGPNGLSGWLKDWASKNEAQFDLIIDNVGSDPQIYWQAHHYLKPGKGEYVQVGGGIDLGSIKTLAMKMMWPTKLGGGQRKFQFLNCKDNREDFEMISRWLTDGTIRTIIEDENRFELADVKKAYEKLGAGRTRGKIVIKVGADDQ